MVDPNKNIGQKGEDIVKQYLIKRGFSLLAQNYSVPGYGELDLVFQKNETVYVVEVRSRKIYPDAAWQEDEVFHPQKLRRVRRTTGLFLQANHFADINVEIICALVLRDFTEKVKELRFFKA